MIDSLTIVIMAEMSTSSNLDAASWIVKLSTWNIPASDAVATVSDLVPPTTICPMTGESTTPKDHGNPHLVSGGPTIVLDDENEPPLSIP